MTKTIEEVLQNKIDTMPVECRTKFALDILTLADMAQREDYLDYEL